MAGPPRLAGACRRLASALGVPVASNHGGPGDEAWDGLVFHGSDHDLAAAAAGSIIPLLHAPDGPSDLLQMFHLRQVPVADRMASGSPYPADLGRARSAASVAPFVAHAVASRTGGLPRPWAASRPVIVERDGAPREHLAAAVVVVNAQHVAGLPLAPRSALMDGMADLQVIGGSRRERMVDRRRFVRGLHGGAPTVWRRPASTVRLELPATWHLAVDGLVLGGGAWEIEILPAAWRLWV